MSNYDLSTDYARYPTLSPLSEKTAATYAQCAACGGADFRIQLPHHQIICKKCGTVYRMSSPIPTERPSQATWPLPLSKFQIVSTTSVMPHITFILRPDGIVRSDVKLPRSLCAVAEWTQIVAISAGSNHIAGLHTDGTVTVAGLSKSVQANVQSWSNIISIATTTAGVLGLCEDGTVQAAGVVPAVLERLKKMTSVASISTQGDRIVCIRKDGTLRAIGNVPDEIYGWDQIIGVALETGSSNILGLRRSGRLVSFGCSKSQTELIRNCRDVRAIAASTRVSVALKNDGTIEIISNTTGIGAVLAAKKWRRIKSVWVCGGFITALRDDGFIHCTNPRIQRFIVEALE